MEQSTTPADVRDRLRAAADARSAELAARRRWATIYRNGRRPADARLRLKSLRAELDQEPDTGTAA
jgi:muconolactone delta-isomerase